MHHLSLGLPFSPESNKILHSNLWSLSLELHINLVGNFTQMTHVLGCNLCTNWGHISFQATFVVRSSLLAGPYVLPNTWEIIIFTGVMVHER